MGMRVALGFVSGLVVVPVILATGCGGQTSADRKGYWSEAQAVAVLARQLYEDERSYYERHEVGTLGLEVSQRPMWPRTADWTATHVRNGEWRVTTNQGTYSVFETGEPSAYLGAIPLAVGDLVSIYLRGGSVIFAPDRHRLCHLVAYEGEWDILRARYVGGYRMVGPGAHATVVEVPPECSGEIAEVQFGSEDPFWVQTRNLALRQ